MLVTEGLSLWGRVALKVRIERSLFTRVAPNIFTAMTATIACKSWE